MWGLFTGTGMSVNHESWKDGVEERGMPLAVDVDPRQTMVKSTIAKRRESPVCWGKSIETINKVLLNMINNHNHYEYGILILCQRHFFCTPSRMSGVASVSN
jgi:hypothetical protein